MKTPIFIYSATTRLQENHKGFPMEIGMILLLQLAQMANGLRLHRTETDFGIFILCS